MPKAKKVNEPTELQRFFVAGNKGVLNDEDLAKATRLSVEQVQKLKAEEDAPKPSETNYTLSMHRTTASGNRKSGVWAMTEEASVFGDRATKQARKITQVDINVAAQAGDFKKAAELAERLAAQERLTKEDVRERGKDKWHFIH